MTATLTLPTPMKQHTKRRKEEVTVTVAGRVSRRATQGKLFFYDVNQDGAKVRTVRQA